MVSCRILWVRIEGGGGNISPTFGVLYDTAMSVLCSDVMNVSLYLLCIFIRVRLELNINKQKSWMRRGGQGCRASRLICVGFVILASELTPERLYSFSSPIRSCTKLCTCRIDPFAARQYSIKNQISVLD